MTEILNSAVEEMSHITEEMYRHGWDERNSGNISLLMESDFSGLSVKKILPMDFIAPAEMIGKKFLITGTGKYFKNVKRDPEANLGLIRISEKGAELLWGFSDGGTFTSELPAHLMSHAARLKTDPGQRVIMHCHPQNLLAMTYVHDNAERAFTRTLWQMCTESMIIFPDGVGVLPWMLCGTTEIGEATAEKMRLTRLVVWAQHGIYGSGNSLDEAYGLIETAEKAAEIYLKIAHLPRLYTLSDGQLRQIAKRFDVTPREEFLDE